MRILPVAVITFTLCCTSCFNMSMGPSSPPAKTSDVVVRLTGGNLEMAALTGSKDVDSQGGNIEIATGSRDDYASVDATVKAGNLDGGAFGEPDGTISHHLAWWDTANTRSVPTWEPPTSS